MPAVSDPVDNVPPSNASLLDGVRARVKSGDPVLNREEVKQIISDGWRPKQ